MTVISTADRRRLSHIVDACERTLRYTDSGRASLEDERTFDAVLHCLTVVGEALGALSDDGYASLPSVPVRLPRAHRNLIVHEDWRVDSEAIWKTVAHDLPVLLADAERLLDG